MIWNEYNYYNYLMYFNGETALVKLKSYLFE